VSIVWCTNDLPIELQPNPSFALQLSANDEDVTAGERCFVVDLNASHNQVDAPLGQLAIHDPHAAKQLVPGVLQLVQMDRVVNDMARVAFIVTDFELNIQNMERGVRHGQFIHFNVHMASPRS